MTGSEIMALLASIIAVLGSLISLFISTRLAVKKERRQLLWNKELDRFFRLEELAGEIVESKGSYRPVSEDRVVLGEKFNALEVAAGSFRRYPEVKQAIRDLDNVLNRMSKAKEDHREESNVRAELDPAFRKLLAACDNVVGRGVAYRL